MNTKHAERLRDAELLLAELISLMGSAAFAGEEIVRGYHAETDTVVVVNEGTTYYRRSGDGQIMGCRGELSKMFSWPIHAGSFN